MPSELDCASQAAFGQLTKDRWNIREGAIGKLWEVLCTKPPFTIQAYGSDRSHAWFEATDQYRLLEKLLSEEKAANENRPS